MKQAVVTCITDNFVGLGATFLASLAENSNLKSDVDVVVLSDDKYAPLSQSNKRLLLSVFPGLTFISPSTNFLNDELVKRWKEGAVTKEKTDSDLPGKKSVYIKLSVLTLTQYDSILWMDSDMLVLKAIDELFMLPCDLAMVRGGKPHHHFGVRYGIQKMGFNAGLMLIRKPYIGKASFAYAVQLLNEKRHTEKQDQSLLNYQWLDEPRMYLPHHYNWKVGLLNTDKGWDDSYEHARIIHFDGPCKWLLKEKREGNKLIAYFHSLREKYAIPMVMEK